MENAQNYKPETDESNFFVIFPTNLLNQFTPRQCVLAGMLIGMAKKTGFAYPSNGYLTQLLNASVDVIQRDLKALEEAGAIRREMVLINGQMMRRIYPMASFIPSPHRTDAVTTTSESPSPSPQNGGINKDIQIVKNNIDINNKGVAVENFKNSLVNLFPQFWAFYGRKGNRKNAEARFYKLTETEFKAITKHLPEYIKNHRDAGKMEFLPHFTTYLNQRRWEDELPYQTKTDKIMEKIAVDWNK